MTQYKVQLNSRNIYFKSLCAARTFCNEFAAAHNIILSIVEVLPN